MRHQTSKPAKRTVRAIVLEPFATGHRPSYVSWITDSLLRSDVPVSLVAPRPVLDHPAISALTNTGIWRHRLDLIEVVAPRPSSGESGAFALWRSERRMYAWLADAHRSAGAAGGGDLVIVPYLDYCFHYLAINGSAFHGSAWCGITMRTEFPRQGSHLSAQATLRIRLLKRMLTQPSLRALFSIDPSAQRFIAERLQDRRWSALHYLPDPAEPIALQPKMLARQSLGLAKDQGVVLLFGSIDPRKGLQELLQGAAALPDRDRWTLLIAGHQTPQARALIRSWRSSNASGPQLWIHDAFVEPSLAGTLFGACDVVWVGYPTHRSMSGVLVQAGLAGKTVVAHEGTLIAALAGQGHIGTVCDVRSPQAVARSLALAAQPDRLAAAESGGPVSFAGHRLSSAASGFVQALLDRDGCVGLSPLPAAEIESQCAR